MSQTRAAEKEFRRRFWLAISLPLLLMAVLAVLFFLQTTRLVSAVHAVSLSDQILTQAERAQRQMIETESNLEGFLLEGDNALLPLIARSSEQTSVYIGQLNRPTDPFAERNDRIIRLRRKNEDWNDQVKKTLQHRLRGGPADQSPTLNSKNRALAQSALADLQGLIDDELEIRAAHLSAAQKLTQLTLFFGLALTLALGVLLSLFTRKQLMRISRTYQAALDATNEKAQYAQQALRSRDEFLSIAAHELKTPMTTLSLRLHSLDMTLHGELLPAHKAAFIENALHGMSRQVRRISQLIENMLDVADIHSRRMRFDMEMVQLDQIILQVLDDLHESIEQSGCHIEISTETSVSGHWDRTLIAKVLRNLLGNAIKYAPGTSVVIRTEIIRAPYPEKDRVRMTITDHGIGIAKRDHPRIFHLFERAVSARHYGGLGTGLYIVREIIESHGGTIRMRSIEGQGATFIIDLPMSENSAPAQQITLRKTG